MRYRSRPPLSGPEGFTLLEVMVAMFLVAVAFMVLLQTDGLNSARTLHAGRLSGAVMLAQEKMEDIFATGVPEFPTEAEGIADGPYTVETTVSATEFAGVSQVRLTVRWNEGDREESYSVLAYIPE